MASIGDYWDEQTIESIIELLREYNDLFPTTFTDMKGIIGGIFIKELEVELITKEQQWNKKRVKELLSCYHVQEEALDEDDPHDI